MEETMDHLSNTTWIDVLKKLLNHIVFISNDVRDNLLLLSVDQELNNFAKVSGKNWIDFILVIADLQEFEKAVK